MHALSEELGLALTHAEIAAKVQKIGLPVSGATCCAGVRCSGQSHSEWHTIDCQHVTVLHIIEHQHLSYNLVYSLPTKIVGARLLLTIRPCATMLPPKPKLVGVEDHGGGGRGTPPGGVELAPY